MATTVAARLPIPTCGPPPPHWGSVRTSSPSPTPRSGQIAWIYAVDSALPATSITITPMRW